MSIGVTTIILFAVFALLLFASCPISVSIVLASIVAAISSLSWDQITFITMQKMNSGVESFSLLAIPLFILAGNIMNNGGIARRLVNFAQLFVGWIPGSLAQANIVGNMLFGALSGSSVAAASAMGGCIYPIQKDEGYDPAFATAANIASAPTGLLIPPTSAFIVYSTVAGGVSISTLFMAGYIPGILMGLGSMVVAFVYAKKHKYPVSGMVPACLLYTSVGVGLKFPAQVKGAYVKLLRQALQRDGLGVIIMDVVDDAADAFALLRLDRLLHAPLPGQVVEQEV